MTWFVVVLLLYGCLTLPPSVGATVQPAVPPGSQEQCLQDVTAKVQASCTLDLSEAARQDVVKRLVSRTYATCIEDSNSTSTAPDEVAITTMVPTEYFLAYTRLASAFQQRTGRSVSVFPIDSTQIVAESTFVHANNLSSIADAWAMELYGSFYLAQLKALTDLTNFTLDDAGAANTLRWQDDVPPGVRRMSYYYSLTAPPAPAGRVAVQARVPLDGSAPLLFYRSDVLGGMGMLPPRTWSEALYVASRVHGRDLNGDGAADYGICWQPDEGCQYAWALGMVLAPYLQHAGTSQGALLDPESLRPLFGTPGAQAALDLFAQLLEVSAPLAPPSDLACASSGYALWLQGRCALAVGWGALFKMSELGALGGGSGGSSAYVKGRYAMALLPGSEQVLDRDGNRLVGCTPDMCVYGLDGLPELIQRQQDNAAVYVNRAPFVPVTGVSGVVSGLVPAARQRAAFDFLAFVSASNLNLSLEHDSPTVPFRASALDPALLPQFEAAGYAPAAAAQYLRLAAAALEHPNAVIGPDIPRVAVIRTLLASAAVNASLASNSHAVLAQAQSTAENQVVWYQSGPSWRSGMQAAYWGFLNFTPAPANDTGGTHSSGAPAVSLAVPIASAVIVVLLSTLYEFKKHRDHRSLFGKVVAPGPFEDTTLLVTDIQDSTALWEMLPSHVMDKAIKEHHSCIRKLLLKHSGYESATEGDSFLLAFHCPEDALLFAMEAQVALLECDWRAELLNCDVCRPCYVVQNEQESGMAGLLDGGDGSHAGLMAMPRRLSNLSHEKSSSDDQFSSPQGSNGMGLSQGTSAGDAPCTTFVNVCQASWKEANQATPNNVLIFRGLRVRMGMHTGIHNDADVAYNKAAARMQYSGEILQYAKAVSDAAAGGMILLSEATYKRLPMERLWDKAMVMHVGDYKLKDSMPVLPLYQVTGRRLMGRVGLLGGMRYKEQLSMGALSAPLGTVAVACLGVAGVRPLLAWSEEVTREGLALLQAEVLDKLKKWNGYLADVADDAFQVAFPSAADAMQWALATHQGLLECPWAPDLLDHELCEELVVGDIVVFRGLRVKTGVEMGRVVGEVNALSGRITYRGKAVLRAERIMSSASSNQVLCSAEAWASAQACAGPVLSLAGVRADKLGPFKLKGVVEKVEVMQVRLARRDLPGADGWAHDLSTGLPGNSGPGSRANSADAIRLSAGGIAMTAADGGPLDGADMLALGGALDDATPPETPFGRQTSHATSYSSIPRDGGAGGPAGSGRLGGLGGRLPGAGVLQGLLRNVTNRASSFTGFRLLAGVGRASGSADAAAGGASVGTGAGSGTLSGPPSPSGASSRPRMQSSFKGGVAGSPASVTLRGSSRLAGGSETLIGAVGPAQEQQQQARGAHAAGSGALPALRLAPLPPAAASAGGSASTPGSPLNPQVLPPLLPPGEHAHAHAQHASPRGPSSSVPWPIAGVSVSTTVRRTTLSSMAAAPPAEQERQASGGGAAAAAVVSRIAAAVGAAASQPQGA